MLVLQRSVGETICIADNIKIKVLSVKGGYVRIGIVAPREIPIHREEIYERIQKEKIVKALESELESEPMMLRQQAD